MYGSVVRGKVKGVEVERGIYNWDGIQRKKRTMGKEGHGWFLFVMVVAVGVANCAESLASTVYTNQRL